MEIIYLNFIIGAAGALIRTLIEDGAIVLPNLKEGKFYFGGIGGLIIGAAAGCIADNNPLTTFLGGYAGTSVINHLVQSQQIIAVQTKPTVEERIRLIAKQQCVDDDLAVRVAKCESKLKADATNVNKDGSIDRGIFQINNKYHPEVTDQQAFDVEFSAKFFCDAFKGQHLDWWNASKTCWDI